MGRTNDKTIKEALQQMLKVYKIKRKFDETAVVVAWPELVGRAVANRTKELFISDKKLFIRLESSVIRNELILMRSQIIERLNEKAGTVVVEELVFL